MSQTVDIGIIRAVLQAKDELTPVLQRVGVEGRNAAKNLTESGRDMADIGGTMTKAFTLPIIGVGAAATKMATDLNSSLANVSALLTNLSGAELDAAVGSMKTSVRELAVDMGKSTGDISGGLYEVISSLGYTDDSFSQLEISAKAGAAGLATTQQSFNFLSAVTKTYGDTSEAAFKKAADLGFQAVNFGQTTFPELAASIGGVAPIAKVAGVSMEEMFAVLATATGVTGNTSEVVTQMGSAINALLNPSDDLQMMFEKIGVKSGEALIQQKGFGGALQEVAKYAKATDTPMLDLLGRKEAFILTASLAGGQAKNFALNLDRMGQAAQANGSVVDAAFRRQTEGINAAGFAWQQFKAEVQVTLEKLGDRLIPVLLSAAESLRPLWQGVMLAVEQFGQLPQPIQTTAIAMLALFAAAGPVVWTLGQIAISGTGLVTSIVNLSNTIPVLTARVWLLQASTVAMSTAKTVFAAILASRITVIALGVAAIAGLAYAVLKLTGTWDPLVQAIKDVGAIIAFVVKGAFNDAVKALNTFVGWLSKLAAQITGPVIAAFKTWVTWLKDHIPGWIINLVSKVGDLGKATKDAVVEGAASLHHYAEAARDTATSTDAAAKKSGDSLRRNIGSAAKPVMDAEAALRLLTEQVKSSNTAMASAKGGYGFGDSLKSARAEIENLSPALKADLAAALRSGAFEMEELKKKTGLSEAALKMLTDQTKESSTRSTESARALRELREAAIPLTLVQRQQVIEWDRLNQSTGTMAKALGISEAAVGAFREALKTLRTEIPTVSAGVADFAALLPEQAREGAEEIGRLRIAIGYLKPAIDSIDHLPKVLGDFAENTSDVTKQFKNLHKASEVLPNLAKMFTQLGETAQGSLGEILGGVGAVIVSMNAARKAEQEYFEQTGKHAKAGIASTMFDGGAKGADRMASAISSAAAIAQGAMNVWSATASKATAAGNAMAGAMAGAQAGAAFGPYGVAIGAAAGLIVGLVRGKPDWAKAADEVGRDFGVKISKGLADAIAKEAKTLGGDRVAAELKNLDKIIGEAGGVAAMGLDKAISKTRDLFVMIDTGGLSVAQAGKTFDTVFAQLIPEALDKTTGLAKSSFIELIHLNERFGTESANVTKFVTGQVQAAVAGITEFLQIGAGGYTSLAEKQKELADLEAQYGKARGEDKTKLAAEIVKVTAAIADQRNIIDVTAVSTQNAATAMSAALVASFDEFQKRGLSITDALKAVEPGVIALRTQLEATGLSGGSAFDQISKFVEIAKDKIAGPALNAVAALNKTMLGLHNSGLLNQEMFTGLSGQVSDTYRKLVAQGQDGDAVMRLMKPTLQTLWQLQQDFGYEVDASTQKLIDQAVEAGVVGNAHKDAMTRAAEAMERVASTLDAIATGLGVTVPKAAKAASTAAITEFEKIRKAAEDAEDAVNGVSVGHSPGGLKDIPPYARRASDAMAAFGRHTSGMLTKAGKDVDTFSKKLGGIKTPEWLKRASEAAKDAYKDVSREIAILKAPTDLAKDYLRLQFDRQDEIGALREALKNDPKYSHGGNALDVILRMVDEKYDLLLAKLNREHEEEDLPGFASGTGGRYVNFGQRTRVELHGKERISTESEGLAERRAQQLSTASLERMLERYLSDQPRAIGIALKEAIAYAPRPL